MGHGNALKLDSGGGYATVYIHQQSITCLPIDFMIHKVYFNKAVKIKKQVSYIFIGMVRDSHLTFSMLKSNSNTYLYKQIGIILHSLQCPLQFSNIFVLHTDPVRVSKYYVIHSKCFPFSF